MRALVACEESQAVTKELRRLGHEAYSCDVMECSGGHPEWHIMGDVLPLLDGDCEFMTMDGQHHKIEGKWDLIIAHPPCTFLTVTGNRWFNMERYGEKAAERIKRREEAIAFFMAFANADCPRIAIENPIGIMSTTWRKADQIIQPWQFAIGEEEKTEKSTCLWLKGLSPLKPVYKEKPELAYHEWVTPEGKRKRQTLWYYNTRCLPHSQRAKAASKTFPGIAKAMAEQWAGETAKSIVKADVVSLALARESSAPASLNLTGFHQMDCMQAMKAILDQYFDLAIVDPPYYSGPEKRGYYGKKVSSTGVFRAYNPSIQSWSVPGKEYFDELLRVSKHYIVWGCNYFDYSFAPGRIVWDKCNGESSFSDAEIAATDLIPTVRLFPFMWNGMFQGMGIENGRIQQGNKSLNEKRIHPTQKPVALYTWLLQKFAKPGWKILDTHVGSASSLIACERMGFEYLGLELDPHYYQAAKERMDAELSQISIAQFLKTESEE